MKVFGFYCGAALLLANTWSFQAAAADSGGLCVSFMAHKFENAQIVGCGQTRTAEGTWKVDVQGQGLTTAELEELCQSAQGVVSPEGNVVIDAHNSDGVRLNIGCQIKSM